MAGPDHNLNQLFSQGATQDNPIDALRHFLDAQRRIEKARDPDDLARKWRFVGYVLDLGYDGARIITSDPYKLAVGGIPRGSFLIMVPADALTSEDKSNLPPHFTLLRVTGVSTTPLSNQVQQTYFELQKRSMPDLDVWTQAELQWGALDCDVLGMFYADPKDADRLAFSGDVNNVVSAHNYQVFAPDRPLLEMIVNGMVGREMPAEIGVMRATECEFGASPTDAPIPVKISMRDFAGRRTAMFGKTRLGKSNVVKLIAQGMIDATDDAGGDVPKVGQLIFDPNGEYANDNPQDGNRSIRSANEGRCTVYALTKRAGTPSRPLRLNFYEQPDTCLSILAALLRQDGRNSIYISSFTGVTLPSLEDLIVSADPSAGRLVRKVQMYWAVLYKAGFDVDEKRLLAKGLRAGEVHDFDPHFDKKARELVHGGAPPAAPTSPAELVAELEMFARHIQQTTTPLLSSSKKPLFDADDEAMLKFLAPTVGAGPSMLRAYLSYHSAQAGDFVKEILDRLDAGRTVILDLGNATDEMRRYFSDLLSRRVFAHQEGKFVADALGGHFAQLYFEEAQNLFPVSDKDLTGPYARFAKEGAKFHIGMVYSTQSPSTINRDLLSQTENFFVGHLSSIDEAKALTKAQGAFAGIEPDILRARTPGYMRMLTQSHRFVVPVQATKFEARAAESSVTPEKAGGKGWA